jgi:protein SCO1/2/putative membrane protein
MQPLFYRRLVFIPLLLLCLSAAAPLDDDLGAVGDFSLTERSGNTVSKSDLLGNIWIASFEFTRCTQGCPQISATLEKLQADLARFPDVRLVTFTVDPKYDGVEQLREYAKHYHADPERWLFLTGEEDEIYRLIDKSFHLPAQQNEGEERKPGNEVRHSSKLVLVDRQGHIRGFFEGRPDPRMPDAEREYEKELRKLKAKVASLEHDAWYLPSDFPRFNATLNACTAMLLLLGYSAIRSRLVRLHITCMLLALGLSALFLVSYGYDHAVIKKGLSTSFTAQTSHASPPNWVGIIYQAVLWTHIPLAGLIVPLALFTAYQGLRGQLRRHVRLARWTLPIWLYVAITGVVVYWMLYRLYPLT